MRKSDQSGRPRPKGAADKAGPDTLAPDAVLDLETGLSAADHFDLRLWLRMLACTHWIEGEIKSRLKARFGITLAQRHRALGDAIGTGQVFLRLLDLLEAAGVRSLGGALALAERAVALRRRQAAEFGPSRGRAARRAGSA